MSNSRLDGVRKGTRIPDLLLRRQSLYPTELYGPIVLKPAISRGLTPYIVFLGLDNILSEEGIIHGLLLSIYCRVRSHFSRRIELTTELLFFSRLVLALFLRRRPLYTAELLGHMHSAILPEKCPSVKRSWAEKAAAVGAAAVVNCSNHDGSPGCRFAEQGSGSRCACPIGESPPRHPHCSRECRAAIRWTHGAAGCRQ